MINSADVQMQLQRAQGLFQARRGAEAWTAIAPLRPAIDGHGQALRLYAMIAEGIGRIDEAADALRRIITIEREPPEIIGALADMLGKAGRHDESVVLWTRLVALHPHAADAHLNRAVGAANAGQHELAVAAATEGLARFPGHARLLATRAMALKNVGQLDEALAGFDLAIAADPNRALTRHNQAVTLRAASRFDEACEAFAKAGQHGMSGAHFLSNWAAAALEAGHVDQAADLYQRALHDDPTHDSSRRGLTRLEVEYRHGEGAFDHYAGWARRANDPRAWTDWVTALTAHQRHAEAEEAGREGLMSFPDDPALIATTEFAAGIIGDAARSLEAFDRLPPAVGDNAMSMVARAQLALRAGRPALAAELAESYQRNSPGNQIGWSLLGLAWRLLDDPREAWLCDYQRLVMVTDVPSPDNMPADEFANLVCLALDPLHQALDAPGDQSLRDGTQTSGALFDLPDPVIQRFRQAVMDAATAAVGRLPVDLDHPFLARKSTRLGFSGSWSVRLRGGGGHHVPHFHGHGWMSSAYYARLPVSDEAARRNHEGWIEFGRPPAMFNLDLDARRVVEPRPGRLVLFPSYLWHGTIPFGAGTGDRLTAAFDFHPR